MQNVKIMSHTNKVPSTNSANCNIFISISFFPTFTPSILLLQFVLLFQLDFS